MCVVSMVGDYYKDAFEKRFPTPKDIFRPELPKVSQFEFDQLKKEVLEMKELLIKAKAYDEKNNEPHCEQEDKIAVIKKVAEYVGVDLTEVFGKGDKDV